MSHGNGFYQVLDKTDWRKSDLFRFLIKRSGYQPDADFSKYLVQKDGISVEFFGNRAGAVRWRELEPKLTDCINSWSGFQNLESRSTTAYDFETVRLLRTVIGLTTLLALLVDFKLKSINWIQLLLIKSFFCMIVLLFPVFMKSSGRMIAQFGIGYCKPKKLAKFTEHVELLPLSD